MTRIVVKSKARPKTQAILLVSLSLENQTADSHPKHRKESLKVSQGKPSQRGYAVSICMTRGDSRHPEKVRFGDDRERRFQRRDDLFSLVMVQLWHTCRPQLGQ
jgi:hypothetical protein